MLNALYELYHLCSPSGYWLHGIKLIKVHKYFKTIAGIPTWTKIFCPDDSDDVARDSRKYDRGIFKP